MHTLLLIVKMSGIASIDCVTLGLAALLLARPLPARSGGRQRPPASTVSAYNGCTSVGEIAWQIR